VVCLDIDPDVAALVREGVGLFSGSGLALSYSKLLINLYIAAANKDPVSGPSQYNQWYPSKLPTMTAGPKDRAGLSEPPVQNTPNSSARDCRQNEKLTS